MKILPFLVLSNSSSFLVLSSSSSYIYIWFEERYSNYNNSNGDSLPIFWMHLHLLLTFKTLL